MTVPAGMTATTTGVAEQSLPDFTIAQPADGSEAATVISASVLLYSSTNSSSGPAGPDARSSLIITVPGVPFGVIVPTAWASVIVAPPVTPLMLTRKVSFVSVASASARTGTETVCTVWPGLKVSVPLVGV